MTVDRACAHDPQVLLVDPSLFTEPYDAGLSKGLDAAGVPHAWAIRPVRHGQARLLPAERSHALFYRHVDDSRWIPRQLRGVAKAVSHLVGLGRLARLARHPAVRIVHFQWTVLPLVDAVAIALLRRWRRAIVVTVHDTTPFNGDAFNVLQRAGFFRPARMADAVIVHTRTARERLIAEGVAAERAFVVPHGPLPLRVAPAERLQPVSRDARRTFTLFGQMKPYKGIDVLIEAVALLPRERLGAARIVVAGAAMMDISTLERRIAELDLIDTIVLRPGRLSEPELAALFDETDVFVFPYRQIDASGAYYTVRPLGKWIVASRIGVFAEDFVESGDGRTVPPEDPSALAEALVEALNLPHTRTSTGGGASWAEIAHLTGQVYRAAERRLAGRARGVGGPT